MKLEMVPLKIDERTMAVKSAMAAGARLGLITSIDGKQLITLLLMPETHSIICFETPLEQLQYHSMTPVIPQAHWFERTIWDMFGLLPQGHPRLKRTHLHEPYSFTDPPLATVGNDYEPANHAYEFLNVEGEGVYELPVGPIHAGIIEPGHFRFSCYGEVIVNLEIRLGYVHRGIEKKITEVPWRKARFVAEAAASDMAVANALAHSIAIESLLEIELPRRANLQRTAALEIERLAMHLSDLGGLAGDIGFLAISSSMARLRGLALRMGELIAGNRFMRGYICPGGTTRSFPDDCLQKLSATANELSKQLGPVVEFFMENQVAIDRMQGIGKVSRKLAFDFDLVGGGARACGIDYDCRKFWAHATFPQDDFVATTSDGGDVLARAKVRIGELQSSLGLLSKAFQEIASTPGSGRVPVQDELPANSTAVALVESHRGELIHLLFTNDLGQIQRYCIKDPSVNNWTGLAIAVRNNLIADFPLCNKSFSLSYSGHDL